MFEFTGQNLLFWIVASPVIALTVLWLGALVFAIMGDPPDWRPKRQ